MKHVHEQLTAWISGELDAQQATAIEQHLARCASCAAEAKLQEEIWNQLATQSAAAPDSSIWPSVRERTFGQGEKTNWFFGGSSLVRSSLAAGAVAAGLLAGMLVPGGASQVGGGAEALTAEEFAVETVWLAESSWGAVFTDLQTDWLSAGYEDDSDKEEEGS